MSYLKNFTPAPATLLFIVSILILIFSPSGAYSQSIITLDQESIQHIGKKTYYYEDVEGKLSLNDVLSGSIQKKFEAYHQDAPNFSSTGSAYWLKFEIEKKTPEDVYLEVGTSFMDSISLYELNQQGELISARYSGDDLRFSSREVEVGNFLFELVIPPGKKHIYYLRIKSTQPLFFPLRVGSLKSFVEFNHDLDYLQGIYFGFMLLIFLYNLFLYFKTREGIYLYYIAYVFSITWFMASVYGYFFEYLWPDSPSINRYVVISSGLTMVTATLFTQKFLDIKSYSIRMYYGTQFFLVIGFLVCLLVVFDQKIAGLQVAQGGLLSMAVFYLFLGIFFKLKGRKEATYYLIAWGVLLTGIICALLESLNLLPVMPYVNAMQIGSGLEALLLSFALGEKISTYKKQREEAMAIALASSKEKERLIQDQNIKLEKEVRKRTKKIAQQNEELISINEEKNRLIGIVAHDLRSPLNQILGLITILKNGTEQLPDENMALLGHMQKSAERQREMIRRILDVNAIESKTIKLNLSDFNISNAAKAVLKDFIPLAKEKSIKLELHAEGEGDFSARLDEDYLLQVLENLVSNAIKFTPHNSNVQVLICKTDKFLEIEVIDNGPGINEEDKKNLFKPYQKLSAQPTGNESSTGLGLFIAKKYTEAMGGKIFCKSHVGDGTKFVVRFPVADS